MNTNATRAEPRPFEEAMIASTLESATGQEALMGAIHRLSQERNQLQARLARHPWSEREAAARIRAITSELDSRWAEVRRSRAVQRVRMEEALGIDPAARPQSNPQATRRARRTERTQAKKHRFLPLAVAS